MLKLHNGIKFYFDLQCLMVKYLDGEVLTQDTRWVSSRRQSVESANNEAELLAKLQSGIDLIKQKIPDLEARDWRGVRKGRTIDPRTKPSYPLWVVFDKLL